MTKIKFCGLTRPSDAMHAETAGAAYAGVVFADSPRQVEAGQARDIFDAAPSLKRVGVFGRMGISGLLRYAREGDLDVLQLHGNFSLDDFTQLRQEFEGELWAVIPIAHENGVIAPDWKAIADVADALLLDSSVRGFSGGLGQSFDWQTIAKSMDASADDVRIVLAGGLTPENVAEAIAVLRPAIVDVSSGVESAPGVKDHSLMTAFARTVRSASIV